MRLLVCAVDAVAALCRFDGPSHLLTLLSPGEPDPLLPADIRPTRRLRLDVHDVAAPAPGLVAADAALVARLLAFAEGWSGDRPFLIHCSVGVSRSPAAALAIACQQRPDLEELAVARALRAASAQATPNPLLVGLADRALGRDGRLMAAARAIGRGAEFTESASFQMELDAI